MNRLGTFTCRMDTCVSSLCCLQPWRMTKGSFMLYIGYRQSCPLVLCVHSVPVSERLQQAYGYRRNVAVPPGIVGAVWSIEKRRKQSNWWLLIAQPHPEVHCANSHAQKRESPGQFHLLVIPIEGIFNGVTYHHHLRRCLRFCLILNILPSACLLPKTFDSCSFLG